MARHWKTWAGLLILIIGVGIVVSHTGTGSAKPNVSLVFLSFTNVPEKISHPPYSVWMLTNNRSAVVNGFMLLAQITNVPTTNGFSTPVFSVHDLPLQPSVYTYLAPGEGKVFIVSQPEEFTSQWGPPAVSFMQWRLRYIYREKTLKNKLSDYVAVHSKRIPFSRYLTSRLGNSWGCAYSDWMEKKDREELSLRSPKPF